MKKSVLFGAMAVVASLFTACSQDTVLEEQMESHGTKTITVRIPGAGPATRGAADLAVEGYTLRCIMERVDASGNVIEGSRQVSAVANGEAQFDLAGATGEYTCLFWADYVKGTDATIAEKSANAFYQTTGTKSSTPCNLTSIGYYLNKTNDLFNNKAADAFAGKIASSSLEANVKVTLKRPFSRISIRKDALDAVGSYDQFEASINAATFYNIYTGAATTAITLQQTADAKVSIGSTDELAFFCYAFSGDMIAKGSEIKFSNSTDGSVAVKSVKLTADDVKGMDANKSYNLTFESPTPSSNIVKIQIDDSFAE